MEYYPAIKKDEIMLFAATWMGLEVIRLSEVSQTEKDKCHTILLMCRILKKRIRIQIKLFTKQKQIQWVRKQTYGYQGEGWGEGIDWEFGIDTYILLYLK